MDNLNIPQNKKMKKYQIIYTDPPWKYNIPLYQKGTRTIESHYSTMTLEEICKLRVQDIVDENAILFLWTTASKLNEAFEVIKSWGFEYITCAVWNKKIIGLGFWFRNQHELLLVGKKGKFSPPPNIERVSSVYSEKRGEHSAKPTYFRNLLSKWFPKLNKIELFARPNPQIKLDGTNTFDGWDVWGNEVKK